MTVSTLVELAEQVHQLVRQYGPARFEDQLLEWAGEVDKPLADFARRRQQHMNQAVSNDRLYDQAAGPPEPDWEWETDRVATAAKKESCSLWFPPEVASYSRPAPKYPLPLPKDRELTLAEKYAVLASIHAVHWKGAIISPWPNEPLKPNEMNDDDESDFDIALVRTSPELRSPSDLPADDPKSHSGWLLYHCLRFLLVDVDDGDAACLKYVLDDVAADLGKAAEKAGEKPRRKRRGRKGADEATRQDEQEIKDDWEQLRKDRRTSKVDYARNRNMTPEQFDELLDRVYQRNRNSKK